jgi:hypothetical protein
MNTWALTPSTRTVGTLPASVVSSAFAIGTSRTSDEVTSLFHQSLETSAMFDPCGCAVMTLRARVSSVTTVGAAWFV